MDENFSEYDEVLWFEDIGLGHVTELYRMGKIDQNDLRQEINSLSLTKQQIKLIKSKLNLNNQNFLTPIEKRLLRSPSPNTRNYINGNNGHIDRKSALKHKLSRQNNIVFQVNNQSVHTFGDTLALPSNEGIESISFSPKVDLVQTFYPTGENHKNFSEDKTTPPSFKYSNNNNNNNQWNKHLLSPDESTNTNYNPLNRQYKASSTDNVKYARSFNDEINQLTHMGCYLTDYCDLHESDLKEIKKLALMELTIIFERNKLRLVTLSAAKLRAVRKNDRDHCRKLTQTQKNQIQTESPLINHHDSNMNNNNTNNTFAQKSLEVKSTTPISQTNDNFNSNIQQPRHQSSAIPNRLNMPGLEEMLANDRKHDPNRRNTPILFEKMIRYLEKYGCQEEGIFRISGSAHRIKSLIQNINTNEQHDRATFFEQMDCNARDVASLLKIYVRQLPNPLLTRKHIINFAQISKIPDLNDQICALNYLIILLPDVHNHTFRMLVKLLKNIAQHAQQNKMDYDNLATVLAPTLFPKDLISPIHFGGNFLPYCHIPNGIQNPPPPANNIKNSCNNKVKNCSYNSPSSSHNNNKKNQKQVDQAKQSSVLLKIILLLDNILWKIPEYFIDQLRIINEDKQKKGKKKNNCEYPCALVKPFNCNMDMVEVDIPVEMIDRSIRKIITTQINRTDKVGKVIEKCQNFLFISALNHVVLYECSGNIGERRLNPSYNLFAILEKNPSCILLLREHQS